MGINPNHLRDYIIIPTLEKFNLCSDSAVNLILGTAAVESDMGYFLKQNNGTAEGIYQMEPGTHTDIWINYLMYHQNIASIMMEYLGSESLILASANQMISNLNHMTIMTRIHYLRVPEKLPEANDIAALARYWKKYYNTPLGKGTEKDFRLKYQMYVD